MVNGPPRTLAVPVEPLDVFGPLQRADGCLRLGVPDHELPAVRALFVVYNSNKIVCGEVLCMNDLHVIWYAPVFNAIIIKGHEHR